MPGWRLGYACGQEPLISAIRITATRSWSARPRTLQDLGARTLSLGEDYYRDLRAMCDRKRRTGLSPYEPDGSHYLFVDCSRMGATTGVEAAEILLRTGSSERCPARRAT